jgi:hypothetical protein
MSHDLEHEAGLAAALSDGPEALTPELRTVLAACPDCRRALERLQALGEFIGADAGLEREILEDSRREAGAQDADAVRNALALGRASRRSRPWRLGLVLLTFAACVAVVLTLRKDPDPRTPQAPALELLLGGDFEVRVRLVDGRYDAFEWAHELLPGESYELSLQELEGELVGATLVTHGGLSVPRYAPTEEEERRLPERLRVTVTVRDVEQGVRARASLTASRR